MSEELKPCPFCGSSSLRRDRVAEVIICNKCGAEGPTFLHNGTVVDQWNERRHPKYKDCLTYPTNKIIYENRFYEPKETK
jgi:Lar family restriction alleviation protein